MYVGVKVTKLTQHKYYANSLSLLNTKNFFWSVCALPSFQTKGRVKHSLKKFCQLSLIPCYNQDSIWIVHDDTPLCELKHGNLEGSSDVVFLSKHDDVVGRLS